MYSRCSICPCPERCPCPGAIGQRPDGFSTLCDSANPRHPGFRGETHREAIRLHGQQMLLPSPEETESLIILAQAAGAANPNPPGGCCG